MESFTALPDARIGAAGACSRACLERGIEDLRWLGRVLRDLPYGRTADRADWGGVLASGRGTCSTKHAFLAATAAEQGTPVILTLGLYEMDEANTPGVGASLAAAGLASVPEAHCYVRYGGARIDVTRAGVVPVREIAFLEEEAIEPDQIGDYKVRWHQQRLRAWCRANDLTDWQRVWQVRERCIAALSPSP